MYYYGFLVGRQAVLRVLEGIHVCKKASELRFVVIDVHLPQTTKHRVCLEARDVAVVQRLGIRG